MVKLNLHVLYRFDNTQRDGLSKCIAQTDFRTTSKFSKHSSTKGVSEEIIFKEMQNMIKLIFTVRNFIFGNKNLNNMRRYFLKMCRLQSKVWEEGDEEMKMTRNL